MKIEDITPEQVEAFLRQVRAENFQTPLVAMDYLAQFGSSDIEKAEYLADWLHRYIESELNRLRRMERIETPESDSAEAVVAAFQADGSRRNKNLRAWSVLYYRYVEADFMIPLDDLEREPAFTWVNDSGERGIRMLTRVLHNQEKQFHHQARLFQLPPPEYNQSLLGLSELTQDILNRLDDAGGPGIVSLEGIGGIGKTALARQVAEHMTRNTAVDDVIWITARQEWFDARGQLQKTTEAAQSAEQIVSELGRALIGNTLDSMPVQQKLEKLAAILKTQFIFVVIDNLETLRDVEELLPMLSVLTSPSRFLLTSRYSLADYPYVSRILLPELSFLDSATLLRSHLNAQHPLSNHSVKRIYHAVGGIALALKLVAAQLSHYNLDTILSDLMVPRAEVPSQRSDEMYRYIYRRIWKRLSEVAQQLLLVFYFSVSPDKGAGREQLHQAALRVGLEDAAFQAALVELQDASLLEIAYSSRMPIYSLHRLTFTFLSIDIVSHWSENSS